MPGPSESVIKLDLGPGDVHVPGAGGRMRKGPKTAQGVTMAVNAAKRKSMRPGQFALPAQKKYPIHDAAHTRNAASRLAQQKKAGKISPGDYRTARAAIRRAAKRFGIHSELSDTGASAETNTSGQGSGINVHVRAQLGAGGNLHVRHMSENGDHVIDTMVDGTFCLYDFRPIVLGEEVEPASVGVTLKGPPAWQDGTPKKLVWVQLAEVGAWNGHPAGPFEMTPTTFAEIVRNFTNRGLPVPFDMEHASEAEPTSGTIPTKGAPAHGWTHRMENRGERGLWGLVEWLDYARDGIKAGNFAFLSPAIRFGSKDPRTGDKIGARLTSAAITNQPFLTGLGGLKAASDHATASVESAMADKFQIKGGAKALLSEVDAAASTTGKRTVAVRQEGGKTTIELADGGDALGKLAHKPHQYMPAIKSALKIHDLSSAKEASDHLDKLRDMVDECGDPEGMHSSGVDLGEFTRPLKYLVDAQPGDTWEEVFDAVQALIDAAMDQHMVEEHGAAATDKTKEGAASQAVAVTNATAAGGNQAPSAEETNMTTATDTSAQVLELTNKIAARDTVITGKDGEIKSLNDKISKQDADIKSLNDRLAARDAEDEKRIVGERHSIYKDSRKMSLEAMSALFKSDRALFDKEFPHVEAGQAHLQRNLSGGDRRSTTQTSVGTEGPKVNVRVLALDIARQRGITLGQAQVIAIEMAKAQKAA